MNTRVYTMKVLLVLIVFVSGGPKAIAEQNEGYIEEIVVTATHRDTAMMDTPLTISTLTEDVMIDKGIINIQNLYQSIPGLAYRSNSSTYNTISVRGISPPGDGGATVGVYVDEVPVTDATSGSGNSQITGVLFDLERVEILKGPQGTLFGEGNMGG
ncbi:MAG: Plug domain-containing protein, partial [Pseudomonadota bacterium]